MNREAREDGGYEIREENREGGMYVVGGADPRETDWRVRENTVR